MTKRQTRVNGADGCPPKAPHHHTTSAKATWSHPILAVARQGILIGGTLVNMALRLFVVVPNIYFIITRIKPYYTGFKNAAAWITAWGSTSSAITLSVTLR
ncbi:hypothetical protein TOPH_04760 [Tolypocladium ophioglossoides CBS 100239]|uniref:Uncharacterized protein n=1 Tax=Tolypocladium ophioglossoides (strain CBS 100239) TaxID=1163406 RepID=A0A0L0N926_TOLOC|nr:hypothetical protein TOPH_04760 [Tolypocladium ophioglossoides CBS 100239]